MEKIYDVKQYYTRDVLKEIKLYTLDRKNDGARVIGSLSYRSGNASDCDLFETIMRDNKNDLIALFKKGIQRIVKDLMVGKKQYFLEVKLGLHPLFKNIGFGRCANDNYVVDDKYFDLMNALHTKGFISDEEHLIISNIKMTYPKKQFEYEMIKEIMRKHTVLRWNAKEILQGYKVLKGATGKYTIEEAVCDKSQINIEGIFVNSDGIYTDCSNFFVLGYGDSDKHLLNLSDEALYDSRNYRRENLKQSTYTLTYSQLHPNLFKALKRMLSFGRSFNMIDLIEKVYPLINSQLGQLYQIVSQMKTIMKIIKEHGDKRLLKEPIYTQADKIRFKLQELIFIDHDFSDVYELFNVVTSQKDYITLEDLYDNLNKITNNLLDFINQQTFNEMKLIGLYPLPVYLIPTNKPF